jgi:tetratricopeptide (TPR) repeat protein
MNNLKIVILSILTSISIGVFAQKTLLYTDDDAEFKTGIELFQKEKYAAAQKKFINIIESHPNQESLIHIDAEYYKAVCAIELFNKDGEIYLKQFIKDHPESQKIKTAYFQLGKYNYRKKKYKETLEWFEKVDIYDLTTEELSEFYFKRGYSYFVGNNYSEAKKDFYEIKDVVNKYSASAKYYYAHIAYTEKNYETALLDFTTLQSNETFGSVVPFYIAQIYYFQGRYETVIMYAPPLLDSADTKLTPQIAKIIGESYYRTTQYKEAIPYLKKYEKAIGTLARQDNYEMGYAYYKIKEYDNAISYFIKLTNINEDSLMQNAYYHLGDCYLKMNNKQFARNAFSSASKLYLDSAIQEDALFNYGKLCYELSFNPYNEAIKAFRQYIKNYPNSLHVEEAQAYLVNVYITTKNYKNALEALDQIKLSTPELKHTYQKVALYRGLDLLNNGEYNEAIELFDKSLKFELDKTIHASAIYWKAEAYYRTKNFQKAIENYQEYISERGAIEKSDLSDVTYNVGYAYYKLSDYTNSILWFRKFVTFTSKADTKKINDAYNRIGDGYFMQRDFTNAIDYYNKSYQIKLIDDDYALFQKSLAEGVLKKYADKIADLKLFIKTYTSATSTYFQRAKFELAMTYLADNQNENALTDFKKFIAEYPTSIYVNTALSKLGLIYYNKKEDDNALYYFDQLIKRDRKSAEANEAINQVKTIYTAKGNVQTMQEYLASVGAAIPQGTLDTIAYNIGKNHYLEQDCKNTVTDFEKYIQEFADGVFIIEANFYKAECDFKLNNTDAALTGYSYIITKNKNEFTEQSLLRASNIEFKKLNYTQALDYFKKLEEVGENPKNNASAKVGIMRCNYQLKNYADAVSYSNKVISFDKLSNELLNEAHYIIAQAHLANQKYDDALAEFQVVVNTSKNELASEAHYQMAYIQYVKTNFKQSEKTIFDLLKAEGDYPYWATKALILLADNYIAMKDNFQAKTTLKSVIADSDISELIKIAQEKLDKIIADEEAAKQPATLTEPVKLEFEGNSLEQNKLFTEPVIILQEGEKPNE